MGETRARLRRVWNRLFPNVPLPLRFAPGIWWIARHDAVSDLLCAGHFEENERAFFRRIVKPGMTVVDVGAHAGLYTMIASKLAGDNGRVVAFEPSPRERQRLLAHLRMNHCTNVTVAPVALGDAAGLATLFVVQNEQTGCNSLRPGDVGDVTPVRVPMARLDDYFAGQSNVDVVKMDVEGAELSVLRGAEALFRRARPTLMCEIEQARIAPWGYDGRDIIELVRGWGYSWFSAGKGGALVPLDAACVEFAGNFVAQPQ